MTIDATSNMAPGGVILGLAVGLAEAYNFALGGSVVKNTVEPTVDAHISGSKSRLSAIEDVKVTASEDQLVVSAGAGVVSVNASSTGEVAVGAAVPTNVVNSTVTSFVEVAAGNDLAIDAEGSVAIEAKRSQPQIVAVALGGEQAGVFALGGSVATNQVVHTIDVHVSGDTSIRGQSDVSVEATEETPTIVAAAGSFEISKSGTAIGAAVPTNTVQRQLTAYVGNADQASYQNQPDGSQVTSTSGSVSVTATRTDSLVLAIGVSGEGAETFSLGGSAATNDITSSTVDAHVWGGTLTGDIGVTVHADDVQSTQAVGAGNLDLSYMFQSAGGDGNGTGVQQQKYIDDAGKQAGDDGAKAIGDQQANVEQALDEIRNVDAQENVQQGADNADDLKEAYDDDQAQPDLNVEQVGVGAPDDLAGPAAPSAQLLAGTGVASVGIALANNLAKSPTVIAFAADASIDSAHGTIEVRANQTAYLVTVAGSGSKSANNLAIDTTEATTDYEPVTKAYIVATDKQKRSTASTEGNLILAADSVFHGVTVAGNAAFNGKGTSIAPSVAVTKHTGNTEAYITATDVVTNGLGATSTVQTSNQGVNQQVTDFSGVSVTSTSKEVVTTVAAGIEASGENSSGGNVAASVTINLLDETTKAYVDHSATINDGTSTNRSAKQSINVFADSDTTVHGGGGALGISGGSTWGVGAGADGGNMTTNTLAYLSAAVANAQNNVLVQAHSTRFWARMKGPSRLASRARLRSPARWVRMFWTSRQRPGLALPMAALASVVNAQGSVLVAAQDDTKLTTIAGAIPVAINGNLSVGASVGWLQFKRKETEAYVADNTTVTAMGLASTDTINPASGGYTISYVDRTSDSDDYTLPTFQTSFQSIEQRPDDDSALTQDRNAAGNYTTIRGVAVTANATTTLSEIGASAGGSQNVAIEVSALVSVADGDESGVTHAHIDGEVIAGDLSDQANNADILVTASADFHQLAFGGSVGLGGDTGAASPSFLGTWLALDTEAFVQGVPGRRATRLLWRRRGST